MNAHPTRAQMERELDQLDREIDLLRERIIEAASTKPQVLRAFKAELDKVVAGWN
jgi:hypothetical protein